MLEGNVKDDEFLLYKKELEALRRADYAYSKELLAFARKNPKQPIEDLILASCLMIHDSEQFHKEPIPLKTRRATRTAKKAPINTSTLHPLEAWADYEKSLSKILSLDGLTLNSSQAFTDGNPRLRIKFISHEDAPVKEGEISLVVHEVNEKAEIIDGPSDTSVFFVESAIEEVISEVEIIDVLESATEEPFAFEPAERDVHIVEANPHLEGKANVNLHKDYSVPEELIVDNSIVEETTVAASEEIEKLNKKEHTLKSKGFSLKSKKYEAPEELAVDNTIKDASVKTVQDVFNSESNNINSELVETLDSTINSNEALNIPTKAYEAPEELIVDNSLSVSNIIVNHRPEIKKEKKKLFAKKEKPSEYSGVTEETIEGEGYTRNDIISELDSIDGKISKTKDLENKPTAIVLDERKLAEANEYVLGGDTDLTVKAKEYEAPEELIIDNRLPSVEVQDGSAQAMYVETVDHVLESETEITIKSKKYEAPEELIVDNSIVEEPEDELITKRRGFFGRKDKNDYTAKAQPVIFLPAKPLLIDLPEEPTGGYTYTPKNVGARVNFDNIAIDDNSESASKEFHIKAKVEESIIINSEDEGEDVEKITSEKVHAFGSEDIDFNELADEIAKEKANKVAVSSFKEEIELPDEKPQEMEVEEDFYLARAKDESINNSSFDAGAIIKDIKLIDI